MSTEVIQNEVLMVQPLFSHEANLWKELSYENENWLKFHEKILSTGSSQNLSRNHANAFSRKRWGDHINHYLSRRHCHITTIKGNISAWRLKLLMRRNRSTAKLRNKVCKNLAKFVSWLTNLFHSETKINWYALLLQKFHPKITDGFL